MAQTDSFRKQRNNWTRPSVNPINPNPRRGGDRNFDDYRIRAPWDEDSKELADDFHRSLEAMTVEVKHPWEVGSTELQMIEEQKRLASTYKFDSLFEVPELPENKKKQLAEYKYDPPFNCGFNAVQENKKPAKRFDPNANPKTRDPWAYGSLPSDPIQKKIFERPVTALWNTPQEDNNAKAAANMVSSGDPILDNLRIQLLKHGASGIAGLARKFRIMDDDDSGSLNLNEFRKAMKECKLIDLSEKAIGHLFRYFDRDDSGSISFDEFLTGIRVIIIIFFNLLQCIISKFS
jgi:hypothetical protein